MVLTSFAIPTRLTLLLVLIGGLSGCTTSSPSSPPPEAIQIGEVGPLAQGDSVTLVVVGIAAGNDTLEDVAVVWESLDTARASVGVSGKVHAIGKALPARIRATLGVLADTIVIAITQTPGSIRAPAGSPNFAIGGSLQLEVEVRDLAEDRIAAPTVTFTPNDGALSITPGGQVTLIGAPGPHGVTVHAGAAQGTIQVVAVTPGHPAGSSVTSHSLSLLGWGAAVSAQNTGMVTSPAQSAPEVVRMSEGTGWGPIAGPAVSGAGTPVAVAFSPTGLWAYVPGLPGNRLAIIDFAANTVVDSILLPAGPYNDIVVTADGKTAYVATDAAIRRVHTGSRTLGASIPLGTRPNHLALARGDSILYVSSANGAKVIEVDLVGDSVLRNFAVGGNPIGIAVSPDGTELYVADEAGGRLVTWGIATNALLDVDTLGATIWDLELTPDGTELWVSFPGTQHGTVKAYARSDRSFLRSILVEGSPRRIAFNPAGSVAVVANDASMVNIIQ